jgi:molecular chaperone HtpG
MQNSLVSFQKSAVAQPLETNMRVSKDVLELLSTAMYPDPLALYREYIQNAADAVEQAIREDLFSGRTSPRIDVVINVEKRSIRIRDNGVGISNKDFVEVLTAIGGSAKRGTKARGFRGVGRLAGLGFCQELVMRSKSVADAYVCHLSWDCKKLKQLLRDSSCPDDLNTVARKVVGITKTAQKDESHFFEVELKSVVRFPNDLLLNEAEVSGFLGQVAPVPFSPMFSFGEELNSRLKQEAALQTFLIVINNGDQPLCRPFQDEFELRKGVKDRFSSIEFFPIEGVSGDCDAFGWVLHHGYFGAIPERTGIKGLRLRSGNIQIGDSKLFDHTFVESRFNSWSVGELHTTSNNLLPNGRRDALEFNIHSQNLFSKLQPLTKQIAGKCRSSSAARVKQNDRPTIPFETEWGLNDADVEIIKKLPFNLRTSFLKVAGPIFGRIRKDYHGRKAALIVLRRIAEGS